MSVAPTINTRKKIAQFLPLGNIPKKRRLPKIDDADVPALRYRFWKENVGVKELVAGYKSVVPPATMRRVLQGKQQTHV